MTDPTEPARRPLRMWEAFAVAGLLAAYWIAAVTAAADKSATFDEGVYLAGGYAYWHLNDYRLNAESGHLTQRVAGLALLAAGPAFPGPDHPGWRDADAWAIAPAFVYHTDNDPDQLLRVARLACATLSALVGVLVYGWSRRLFGPAGGLLSLALFAFCPTMLGNGPVVQSDMAAALFFPAAVAGLWAVLHRVTVVRIGLSCLALSGLFLAKLSAPLVVPVAGVLVAVRLLSGKPLPVGTQLVTDRSRQAMVIGAVAALHAFVVWGAVWAAFGFRYAAANDPSPAGATLIGEKTRQMAEAAGPSGRVIRLMQQTRVLPEAYLYGLAYQAKVSRVKKAAFLNGEFHPTGTLLYFPYSFLVKTPLPLFGVLGLAAWGWVRARRAGWGVPGLYDLAPLLALLVVYAGFTTASRLNIGHRYLAPVYPPLFVLAGAAALWLRPMRYAASGVAIAGLLVALAAESLAAWPDYLTYFNPVAGGPRGAYRHLVDSSLDWGQDLPALKRWLDARELPNEREPVFLGYFGTASPEHHGIRANRIYRWQTRATDAELPELTGGVYCVSATTLTGMYRKKFVGPWTEEYEAEYRRLRSGEQTDPALLYEAEVARLCHALRHREPDDRVGYTILVYRLIDADVNAALR